MFVSPRHGAHADRHKEELFPLYEKGVKLCLRKLMTVSGHQPVSDRAKASLSDPRLALDPKQDPGS